MTYFGPWPIRHLPVPSLRLWFGLPFDHPVQIQPGSIGGTGMAIGAGVLVGTEMDCFMDSFRIAWSDSLASGVLGKYSSSSSSSGQYSSDLPAFLRASSSQISNRSKLATSTPLLQEFTHIVGSIQTRPDCMAPLSGRTQSARHWFTLWTILDPELIRR